MIAIKLSKTWQVDDTKPLGDPGGFGRVFCATGEEGQDVAVKLFHFSRKENSARELNLARFISGNSHAHVIPVLDFGTDEYTGNQVIVMARATRSLQQYIIDAAPLSETETLNLLDAIAAGLQEMGSVVHRDLKPANILEHDGTWKVADWGLARFVDAATSDHTMRDFLTAPYAAPELWHGERATKAADVYSLGCVSYALLTGHPPFDGPEKEDFKIQHELSPPPELPASPRLRQLTSRCLAKSPELRPPIDSYRVQLSNIRSPKPVLQKSRLAAAASALAAQRAAEEAQRLQVEQKKKERHAIAAEAVLHVTEIFKGLIDLIRTEAPDAQLETDRSNAHYKGSEKLELVLRLGPASLVFDIVLPYVDSPIFGKTWDVYCLAKIEVTPNWSSSSGTPGRSANLVFGRIGSDPDYGWWEVAFMFGDQTLTGMDSHPPPPFSVGKGHSSAGYRWSIEGVQYEWYQLAHNPIRVDGEQLEPFYQRWIEYFSAMAIDQWVQPQVPEGVIDDRFKMSW